MTDWVYEPRKSVGGKTRWLVAHVLKDGADMTICGAPAGGRSVSQASSDVARCGHCLQVLNAPRTCTVEGCEKGGKLSRGYCRAHYIRLWRKGDVGAAAIEPRRPADECMEPGCDLQVLGGARGYCVKHYTSKIRSGELVAAPARDDVFGERHKSWLGEAATYERVHARLHAWRGRASDRTCLHCASAADQWAYDLIDPDERTAPGGYRYSLNPWHYLPLCRSCHRRFDLVNREAA